MPRNTPMHAPTRPRTVLVTGAARRLGRSIALALAAGGWQVAVHYRLSEQDAIDTVATCARLSGVSGHFDADFSDEAAVRTLLPRVVAHFGAVDAVVNSASLFEHDDPATFGYARLQQHLVSNTAAPIVLAQALHAHLNERAAQGEADAQGAVVNLLDQKLWNQNPDFLSYTLSKAALEAAGTMLALALAPRVRVVGVAPGLTLTSHYLSEEQFQRLHAHLLERASAGERDAQGAVVNLLDQKLWNQNPDFLSYTLSKAALEAAGTMLALALAPRVRVVGVAPGLTLTSHMLSEEEFQRLHTLSPLGRSSTAEDVASAVRFALENRSITGTTLLVDGGQHLMKFDRDFSLM